MEPIRPPRVLGTADLVAANVLVVVGTPMFGTVALLGAAAAPAVLLAALLFHVPLAVVVAHLARARPLTGGTYEWVRLAWGEVPGFLMAWITWAFFLVFIAATPLALVAGLDHLLTGWEIAERSLALPIGTLLFFGLLVVLTLSGLRELRGLQWLAGIGLLLLVLLLAARLWRGADPTPGAWPEADLLHAATFVKFAVFGMAGLECMALLGGEIRQPERGLPRAIALSVPLIILAYLIGGLAIARTIPAGQIDLANPVAQVLRADGSVLAVSVLSLLLLRDFAQPATGFAAAVRLPTVAGWHRMLPAWVARPNRRGVATGAVLVTGGTGALLALWAVLGAGLQEAYQWLLSAAGVLFGLTYLVIFLLPLSASGRLGLRAPWWVRLAAACGAAMTLAFVLLAVYPIVEVADPARYAWRILVVVGALLLPGVVLAWRGMRRLQRAESV